MTSCTRKMPKYLISQDWWTECISITNNIKCIFRRDAAVAEEPVSDHHSYIDRVYHQMLRSADNGLEILE